MTKDTIFAKMNAHRIQEARRREVWGENRLDAMVRLAQLFPSLRDVKGAGIGPWNAHKLLEWLCGFEPTTNGIWAALFVLGVWDPILDWNDEAAKLPPDRCDRCDGPGQHTNARCDDQARVIGFEPEPVENRPCALCDGKGYFERCAHHGRFDVFCALYAWDHHHLTAFRTWIELPFWPSLLQ